MWYTKGALRVRIMTERVDDFKSREIDERIVEE